MMVYAGKQLERIYPYLPREPKWLILGGPADANEAQTAREKWPDIKIIGVEPNYSAIQWQHDHGWPDDCPLIHAALHDLPDVVDLCLRSETHRHATTHPQLIEESGKPTQPVAAITIDMLDLRYGPFKDAILWLDIEGSELAALRGARFTLPTGDIMLVNVEIVRKLTEVWEGVPELLEAEGFKLAHDTDPRPNCHHCDRIYVRKG